MLSGHGARLKGAAKRQDKKAVPTISIPRTSRSGLEAQLNFALGPWAGGGDVWSGSVALGKWRALVMHPWPGR